jgi:hypothetical protein
MAVLGLMPPPNDTCDIYRSNVTPPGPAAETGVKVFIKPNFINIKPASPDFSYTHVICLPLSTDVRDDWPSGLTGDSLYVPDDNSNIFFVERVRIDKAGGNDFLRAYCTLNKSDGFQAVDSEG